MDPVTILGGAVVSVVVQLVKKYGSTSKLGTGVALVVLSLVGGLTLFLLKQYGLWDAASQILVYAGAAYGLILKNVQEEFPSTK